MQDKIEKLMRVANDPAATPAEREAYRRKAEELLASQPAQSVASAIPEIPKHGAPRPYGPCGIPFVIRTYNYATVCSVGVWKIGVV